MCCEVTEIASVGLELASSEDLIVSNSQNSIKDAVLRLCVPKIKVYTESLLIKLKTEVAVKCYFQRLPVSKIEFKWESNRAK